MSLLKGISLLLLLCFWGVAFPWESLLLLLAIDLSMDDFPCSFYARFTSIARPPVSLLLNAASCPLNCLLYAAIVNVSLPNKVYLTFSWKLPLQFTFSIPLKYTHIFLMIKSFEP